MRPAVDQLSTTMGLLAAALPWRCTVRTRPAAPGAEVRERMDRMAARTTSRSIPRRSLPGGRSKDGEGTGRQGLAVKEQA